ncbi:MAG TPA: hypothetical protein VE032_02970 [Actinomycetota bacterium]|nr:hypothetical protein [Actinomycetota bacterium]
MDPTMRELDRIPTTDLSDEIRMRLSGPTMRPVPEPPRTGRRVTAAVVALALFGTVAVLAWIAVASRTSDEVVPATPWSSIEPGWTELPPPPEFRNGAAVVWTGDSLIYWGGVPRDGNAEAPFADGYAFDPVSRRWSETPIAPHGLAQADGIWTGDRLLVWGSTAALQETQVPQGDFGSMLTFDPAAGSWSGLPPSPHQSDYGGTWTWTGSELIVFGGGRAGSPSSVSGAALDPVSGAWRTIADAPLPLTLANGIWTGEEMIVVGAALQPGNHATTPTAVAEAYSPSTDSWRVLQDPPLIPQSTEVVMLGDRIVAWDYVGGGAEYAADTDRWREVDGPPDSGECYVEGVATRGAIFAWQCGRPDAWYPDVGWQDAVGGPAPEPRADGPYPIAGEAFAAGDVVVVEQVDNLIRDGEVVSIGDPEARAHLWAWRAP